MLEMPSVGGDVISRSLFGFADPGFAELLAPSDPKADMLPTVASEGELFMCKTHPTLLKVFNAQFGMIDLGTRRFPKCGLHRP